MACCNGNCGCGSSCKCVGCNGCAMYPNEVEPKPMATFVLADATHKPSSGGSLEMAAENGGCSCNSCKCGTSCGCSCCNC